MSSYCPPVEAEYYRPVYQSPARRTVPPDMPSNEPSKSSTKLQKIAQEEENIGRLSRHTCPIGSPFEDEGNISIKQEVTSVNMLEIQEAGDASSVDEPQGDETIRDNPVRKGQPTIMSALEAVDSQRSGWTATPDRASKISTKGTSSSPVSLDTPSQTASSAPLTATSESGSLHDRTCLDCLGENAELKCLPAAKSTTPDAWTATSSVIPANSTP